MEEIGLNNNSGDREFFTIIPNYIANHSTANDQALYLQLKKHAGESGKCFVSEKTLMEKLNLGRFALQKAFKYLLEHKWIKFEGLVEVKTAGGLQKVKSYSIENIWKMNSDYYADLYNKGVLNQTPLEPRGVQISTRGAKNDTQGVLIQRTNKNHILNKNQEEDTLFLETKEPTPIRPDIRESINNIIKKTKI